MYIVLAMLEQSSEVYTFARTKLAQKWLQFCELILSLKIVNVYIKNVICSIGTSPITQHVLSKLRAQTEMKLINDLNQTNHCVVLNVIVSVN